MTSQSQTELVFSCDAITEYGTRFSRSSDISGSRIEFYVGGSFVCTDLPEGRGSSRRTFRCVALRTKNDYAQLCDPLLPQSGLDVLQRADLFSLLEARSFVRAQRSVVRPA